MKKLLAVILIIAMCFAITACKEETETEEFNLEDAVIGTWEREPYETDSYDAVYEYYEIYKGGTGQHIIIQEEYGKKEKSTLQLTWEVKDDVVNIDFEYLYFSADKTVVGFTYDKEENTLTSMNKEIVVKKQ